MLVLKFLVYKQDLKLKLDFVNNPLSQFITKSYFKDFYNSSSSNLSKNIDLNILFLFDLKSWKSYCMFLIFLRFYLWSPGVDYFPFKSELLNGTNFELVIYNQDNISINKRKFLIDGKPITNANWNIISCKPPKYLFIILYRYI